jgi:hypothetical protein
MLCFGDYKTSFNNEWFKQNLNFCNISKLKCFLSSDIDECKSGVCGILACLQAYLLIELLYPSDKKPIDNNTKM